MVPTTAMPTGLAKWEPVGWPHESDCPEIEQIVTLPPPPKFTTYAVEPTTAMPLGW